MYATKANLLKALTDITVFADLIDFQGGWSAFGSIHRKLVGFITAPQCTKFYNNRRLVLAPRGHLKSTVCCTLYTLWRIYRNPDIRILVGTNKLELSTSFIRELRQYLENPELQSRVWNKRPHIPGRLIPVMDSAGRKRRQQTEPTETEDKKLIWTTTAIQVLRPGVFKEPTVLATSVGTRVTGQHYDLLILDDIVDFDNTSSQTKLDKTFEWAQDLESVLDPKRHINVAPDFSEDVGDEVVVLGTRYDAIDYYNYIIENARQLDYRVFTRNIYRNGVNSDAGFIWPEKFNADVVGKLRNRLTPRRFASQYLNTIITDEMSVLRSDQIKYFKSETIELKNNLIELKLPGEVVTRTFKPIMVVDPAISQTSRADNTVITVGGLDEQRDLFVVDMKVGKLTPQQTVTAIFDMCEKWNLFSVTVEVVGYQAALAYSIKEQFRTRRALVVKEWRPDGQMGKKKARIENGLQPLFANGKIYLSDWLATCKPLHDEILYFPKATAHDDCLDTLEMLRATACPVPKKKHTSVPRQTYNMKYGGIR